VFSGLGQHAQILEGVPGDADNIGERTRRDRANLARHIDQLRIDTCRRANDVRSRLYSAARDELMSLAVTAVGRKDPYRSRALLPPCAERQRLRILIAIMLSFSAAPGGRRVASCRSNSTTASVGTTKAPASATGVGAPPIHESTVLYGADPIANTAQTAFSRVAWAMTTYVVLRLLFLHRRADFLVGELIHPQRVRRRQDAAGSTA